MSKKWIPICCQSASNLTMRYRGIYWKGSRRSEFVVVTGTVTERTCWARACYGKSPFVSEALKLWPPILHLPACRTRRLTAMITRGTWLLNSCLRTVSARVIHGIMSKLHALLWACLLVESLGADDGTQKLAEFTFNIFSFVTLKLISVFLPVITKGDPEFCELCCRSKRAVSRYRNFVCPGCKTCVIEDLSTSSDSDESAETSKSPKSTTGNPNQRRTSPGSADRRTSPRPRTSPYGPN